MSNKVYDILKWICLVVYPSAVVLTGVILNAIGYANTEVVITIMTGIEAFLGAILGSSSLKYFSDIKKEEENWERINLEEGEK